MHPGRKKLLRNVKVLRRRRELLLLPRNHGGGTQGAPEAKSGVSPLRGEPGSVKPDPNMGKGAVLFLEPLEQLFHGALPRCPAQRSDRASPPGVALFLSPEAHAEERDRLV